MIAFLVRITFAVVVSQIHSVLIRLSIIWQFYFLLLYLKHLVCIVNVGRISRYKSSILMITYTTFAHITDGYHSMHCLMIYDFNTAADALLLNYNLQLVP